MSTPGDAQEDPNDVQPGGHCVNGHEAALGPPGAAFCTVCGAPMMVRCPNGHEVAPAHHCTVCGAPLTNDTESPETEGTPEAETLPREESTPEPSRPLWVPIVGAVLLVLLISGGVYLGVSNLTGSNGGRPTNAVAPPPSSSSPAATPSTENPSPAPETSSPTSAPPPTVTVVPPPATVTAPPPSTVTVKPPTVTAPPNPTSTGDVVNAYFAAINAGDYARAWALGGANLQGGSYSSFVQGFSTTAYDSVTIDSVSGEIATIHLDALQTDGTHRYFAGTYTVRGGVIVGADIRQTTS